MFWLLTVKDCKGPNTVHHPKCIRTQEFPLLKGIRILRPLAVLCRVLCSKHNIILKWRIALLVRHLSKMWNVGCRHTAKRAWIKQRKVPGELPGTGVWERI